LVIFKGKAILIHAWADTKSSWKLRLLEFLNNRHAKVVRSAVRTGRLYPQGDIPCTHFYYQLSRPQDHSPAGRIKYFKNTLTPLQIKPAAFRLVAQCLNRLRHRLLASLMINNYCYIR